MRITNFIKNYPCTILLIILSFVSISTIFVESKVYALSSPKAKACDCIQIDCPQELPPETKPCSLKGKKCYCTLVGDRKWTYCPSPSVNVCTLIEGCSSCEECTPSDCNNECDTNGCTGCFTQAVDEDIPCTKPPVECGNCRIIDP